MQLTLGSLFDGIGGFPLAGSRHEFMPVWASEIEPWPIKVTEEHFPGMKHLGDITKVHGAKIEPVDVITFGSPCTRLSVAGKHDGFDITFKCTGKKDSPHEPYNNTIRATNKYQYIYNDICPICGEKLSETNESALFFHAIRIIREMRDATNGIYPRFIVWENVPGAFSSNQGADFRSVLEEIGNAEIPMPKSGRWATAGMVRTETADIAWRVLDAQYHGVPQRRRRIFLVADFAGQCAGEILFVEEGLRGHFAESGEAREEAAADVGNGVETAIPINTQIATRHNKLGRGTGFGIGEDGDPSFTLQEAHSHAVCCKYVATASYWDGGQISDCLDCSMLAKGQMMPEKRRFPAVVLADQGGSVMSVHDDISPTLRAQEHGHQPIVMHEVSRTLRAEAGAPKHEADWESLIIEPRSQDGVCRIHDDGIVPTLNTAQGGQRQPCVMAFTQNQRDEVRDLGNKSGAAGDVGTGVTESSRINSTPEGVSGAVSSKWAKGTGGPAGDEHYNLVITPDVAQCITTRTGCRYDAETETLIAVNIFDPYNNNLSEKCTSLGTNCGMSTGRSIVLRETTGTLRANAGAPKHESDWESLVLEKTDLIIEPRSQDGVCRIHTNGIVPTLNTAQGGQRQPCVISIQNATRGKSQNGLGVSQDNVSYTLDSLGNHAVCIQGSMIGRADKNGPQGDGINEDVSFTLNTTDRHAVAYGVDCRNLYENEEISGTLQTKNSGGYSLNYQNPIRINYAVRRLTPLECLRLQGFPDDWLDIEGMSDTAKYQAVGNSIAIPVVEYIMSQIRAYADQK